MKLEFYKELVKIIDEDRVYVDEPMKKHTTFRVGGNADFFVKPRAVEEIQGVVALCKKEDMPYYILGNGSNLLVGDRGYRGVIIQIYREMNHIEVMDSCIKTQAGALLSKVGATALEAGLEGFEFASGIPGTVGGAVVMNAGAYGGEMKDILQSVTVLTTNGEVKELSNEQLELGYRTSIIARENHIVIEAVFQLKRTTKQPLEYPSAGSTFKRPEGYFAGKLIQDAGLRGFQVGGAQVSEKHCGFVINKEEATAADVAELMRQVSEKVQQEFGVTLEPEVKRLGEF